MITLNTDIQQHYLQHQYATEPTLVEEPVGWRTSNKKLARDKKTGEFLEKNAKDISFIGEGKNYILNTDAVYGVNCKIKYTIVTQNPKDAGDRFEDVYFIDVASIKEKKGKLQCKVDEGGLSKLIKSKQSEKVEIDRTTSLAGKDITELATKKLLVDGRNLFLLSEVEESLENKVRVGFSKDGFAYRVRKTSFPLKITNNNHIDLLQNPIYTNTAGIDGYKSEEMLLLQCDRERTFKVNISGSFWVNQHAIKRPKNSEYRKLSFFVFENGSNYDVKQEINLWTDPSPLSNIRRKVEFSNDIELTLDTLDSFAILFEVGGFFGGSDIFGNLYGTYETDFEDCDINVTIEEDSDFQPTTTEYVDAHDLVERELEIITGQKGKFKSEYLGNTEQGYKENGKASRTAVMPLLWVRGFKEREEKKPSISYKDTIESLGVVWGGSTMIEKKGFEEIVRFEEIDFFYNPNITLRLPNVVEDIEKDYAKDFLYTSYECGFEKGGGDYEEAKGIGEYNGKAEYTNILETDEKRFTKLSKIRGDAAAFEFPRRKHASIAPQEDTRYDYDWGMTMVKEGVTEVAEQKKWQDHLEEAPKGIYSPSTATNLELSPLQIRNRHKFFITTGLQQYPDSKIMFASSNCNSELEIKPIGKPRTKENQHTAVKDIGKSRAKPRWWTFTHEVDFDIQKNLRGKTIFNNKEIYNFYGIVEFKISSSQYRYGYLFEVDENKGKFKVLEANI